MVSVCKKFAVKYFHKNIKAEKACKYRRFLYNGSIQAGIY